jgi:Tfp pilus assembly protein PilV
MNKSGQSLFELLVAIAVVGITLIALIGVSVRALGNSTYSRNKSLSTRYTQEAMEWLRKERDADWDVFYTLASGGAGNMYCLSDIGTGLTTGTCAQISGTVFTRSVILIATGANSVEALITTSWQGDTGMHNTNMSTIFTNWN